MVSLPFYGTMGPKCIVLDVHLLCWVMPCPVAQEPWLMPHPARPASPGKGSISYDSAAVLQGVPAGAVQVLVVSHPRWGLSRLLGLRWGGPRPLECIPTTM